jgi:glutathione S-transferase
MRALIKLCRLAFLIGAIETVCAAEAKPAHPVTTPVEQDVAANVLARDSCQQSMPFKLFVPSRRRTEAHLSMIKLYSADLSPYSARVRMQIYAKGITDIVFELPEHWGMPKFREKFPIGRVPVLSIDGDLIPESEVIAEYLEELYPEPSLLGTTARETAHIRMLARIADIYIINNMFMLARQTGALARQTPAAARNDAVSDQLAGEVVRNIKALEGLIGTDGFACSSRMTLADCALVPGLFLVEIVFPAVGVETPIPAMANVAAYWTAIQKNEHAARVLSELHRGLEERREMIRSGALERFRAERDAAQKAADSQH